MKKILILGYVVLVLMACATVPPDEQRAVQGTIDELMERWITALNTKNIDLMMSTYWPGAEKIIASHDREKMHLHGIEDIAANQHQVFEKSDVFAELHYTEPERVFKKELTMYIYHVEGPAFHFEEHFEFMERNGEWRIIHHILEIFPVEQAQMSEFQAWADSNRNGSIEPSEEKKLIIAVRILLRQPHDNQSPVDEFFDSNRDGHIDYLEMSSARDILFIEQFRYLYEFNPELAIGFDLNEDHWISYWEIDPILDILFFKTELAEPHEAHHPIDRSMDKNNDSFVDKKEIEQFVDHVYRIASLLPLHSVEEKKPQDRRAIWDWADFNHNGTLEPPEIEDLAYKVQEAVTQPHAIRSPVSEYFDRNRDGRIDSGELEEVRAQLLEEQLDHLPEMDSDFFKRFIDINSNGRIDENEKEMIWQFLYSDEWFSPRKVKSPLDERVDKNENGKLEDHEQHEFADRLYSITSQLWLGGTDAEREKQERWEVRTFLDELADMNENGFIDPEENRMMMESLEGPHSAVTEFDRRIDFNRNGEVESIEIMKARRAGQEMEDIEEEGVYSVKTIIDEHLDLDNDGRIDEDEISRILKLILGGEEKADKQNKFFTLFDANKNGSLSEEELIHGRDKYLMPRPVNPEFDLDRKLDKNKDGFIDPEEIGIAAGVSTKGPIPPFEERLERMRWKVERAPETPAAGKKAEKKTSEKEAKSKEKPWESDFYKKLGMIQDKKFAVVGINTGTKNVDSETTSGIMVFIENAFVNIGKVRVVDRQNISKIVKEYEFQQSDLTDETTAVKIGKLSGADIIIIGSINYVGKKFYLNIKLINVETGEIIGSSIAAAIDATEFYDMCNDSVYKLF